MADTRAAIENVRSLARTFQSVIDLAGALDGMANLEQAAAATEARLAKARQILAAAQAECTIAENTRDAALAHAQQQQTANAASIERARTESQSIVQAGQIEALALVDHAKQQAEQMTQAARQEAEQMTAQAEQARQALADIEAKIARAKSKMAELLGA